MAKILAASTYYHRRSLPPAPVHGKHHPFPEHRYIWVVWKREHSIDEYLDGEEEGREPALCSYCHKREPYIFGIFLSYRAAIAATRAERKGLWYNIKKLYDSFCY
jgi:hypothetical protein